LPALNGKIKELFGFEFSELLGELRGVNKTVAKKRPRKSTSAKPTSKRGAKKK